MKYLDIYYVFDASAQTIQFTLFPSGALKKEMILLITNVEDGIIIYRFNGGTGLSGTITPDAGGDILTLEYDTTAMSDTDALQVILDDGWYPGNVNDFITISDAVAAVGDQLPTTLGQKAKAASLSVTLASDEAGQASNSPLHVWLSDGVDPIIGQDTMANSLPVVIASNQSAVPVSDNGGSLTVDNAVLSVVGGGTEATAQRVTIASDSTGVLSVDDNGSTLSIDDGGGNISIDDGGNSITVDGTVAISNSSIPVTDNAGSLTVDAPVGTPVFVRLSDGSSAIATLPVSLASVPSHAVTNAGTFAVQATVAAGSTNIAKAEDDASANLDVGIPAMAVRKATPANTSGADGDYEFLQMSAGRVWTSAVLEAGSAAIGKLASNDGVDIGNVDVASVVPGTGATNLGKAEDAVFADGDTGVMALSVRKNTAAATSGADGDYQPLITDTNGRLHTNGIAAGDVAHDAADSGNPVKVGAKAANAFPTAVANADRADNLCDLFGRQLTSHVDPGMQVAITKTAYNTTSTATGAAMWTPASGKRIAITSMVIGTYGTTAARVIIWIGASGDTTYTAGTDHAVVIASFAPSATVKPGLVFTPAVPIFSATADHILRITTDAGISIDVTWSGYEF